MKQIAWTLLGAATLAGLAQGCRSATCGRYVLDPELDLCVCPGTRTPPDTDGNCPSDDAVWIRRPTSALQTGWTAVMPGRRRMSQRSVFLGTGSEQEARAQLMTHQLLAIPFGPDSYGRASTMQTHIGFS